MHMDQKIVGSIKMWAVVVGILSLSTLWTLSVYPIASVQGVLAALGLILGAAVSYAGLRVTTLARDTVGGIFWAKIIVLVIDFLLFIASGRINFVSLVIVVVEAVIVWYLIMTFKKLHRA